MASYGIYLEPMPCSWLFPSTSPSSRCSCTSSCLIRLLYPVVHRLPLHRLSWADTAASTFGRLYGSLTPPLPKRLFGVLPLAPRKSLAGFIAASLTGAAIIIGFWTLFAPMRPHGLTWSWQEGISQSFIGGARDSSGSSPIFTGWVGLLTIGVVAGLVTGIAEALGTYCCHLLRICVSTDGHVGPRSGWNRR